MNITYPALALFAFVCFALVPTTRAVSPPPDGGYPGFTTAEGSNALQNLTTGVGNTATGWHSLFVNSAGSLNTAIGAGALLFNAGDNNTATGALALANNTTGYENTAVGVAALVTNTEGYGNTAIGQDALSSNTTAIFNTAVGQEALNNDTTGPGNTGIGGGALQSNTTGGQNTALGYVAGGNLTTGSYNIDIGYAVDGVAGESSTIRIGNATYITSTYISGISGQTAAGGAAVFVDSNGKLGTLTSSARFKDEIKPMDKASEVILALKPVTFRYKKEIDPAGTSQFGLVAEEVEKVNPDLVARDAKGKTYTVRYEAVNAMLLNEFLKEHRTVQEQSRELQKQAATIAGLQKQVETLTSGLQKVSSQLELNKPAPQTVCLPAGRSRMPSK